MKHDSSIKARALRSSSRGYRIQFCTRESLNNRALNCLKRRPHATATFFLIYRVFRKMCPRILHIEDEMFGHYVVGLLSTLLTHRRTHCETDSRGNSIVNNIRLNSLDTGAQTLWKNRLTCRV